MSDETETLQRAEVIALREAWKARAAGIGDQYFVDTVKTKAVKGKKMITLSDVLYFVFWGIVVIGLFLIVWK